jgi:hypothetical protein
MSDLLNLTKLWNIVDQFKRYAKNELINVESYSRLETNKYLYKMRLYNTNKYIKYKVFMEYIKNDIKFHKPNEEYEFEYIRDYLISLMQSNSISGKFKSHIIWYLIHVIWIGEHTLLNSHCMKYLGTDTEVLLGSKYLYLYNTNKINVLSDEVYMCIHEYLEYAYVKRKYKFTPIEGKCNREILQIYRDLYAKWGKLGDFYKSYNAVNLGDLHALQHRNYTAIRQNIITLFICVKQFGVYRNLRNMFAKYILQFSI